MPDQDEFITQVRDALHHLYDYHHLENHPLALRYWPRLQGGPSRAHRLSRLLLEAIEELNPPEQSPTDTSRTRFYSLLIYRFVEEWPLADILRELACSRSQFFREQRNAIAMLASVLRERLPRKKSQSVQAPPQPASSEANGLLDSEAERVLGQRESVDLVQVVEGTRQIVRTLAQEHAVSLAVDADEALPQIYANRTVLRQIFLEALSNLITHPLTDCVRLQMHVEGRWVVVVLAAATGRASNGPQGEASEGKALALQPVCRLVEMMGGRWEGVEKSDGAWTCHFALPVNPQRTLLVVDDNEGIIRAFRGYLADYGYQVVGALDGEDALRLAQELAPTAITLDVMMPSQDGWEILQALKDDDVTQHIPVIICSVLEDPDLADSLGAAAYLGKPVSQSDLLDLLDHLTGAP